MKRHVGLALGSLLAASTALAQNQGSLTGRVVHTATKQPVAGAEVQVAAVRVLSDSSGSFRVEGLPPGRLVIRVRRLGFLPESLTVDLAQDTDVNVELQESPQALDTVSVSGRQATIPRGKLAGFYERKQYGIGRFLEASDMETLLSRRLGDILLSRVPGIRIMRSRRSGSAAYVYSTRLGTGCYPDVYLDGAVVYSSANQVLGGGFAGESVLFDVNSIDPGHISAIEYYAGPSQMPAQFNRTGSACGALLLWTK